MEGLSRYTRRWTALGRQARLMLLYRLLISVGAAPFALFFSLYVLSLGYQADFLGLLMGASALPAIFFAVPLGFLARRWGARRTCMVGILCTTGAVVAVCLSTTASALLATRALLGAAMLLPEIALFPLLAGSSRPEQRATLFSADHSVMTLADLVGNMAAGVLPALAMRALGIVPESAGAYRVAMLAGAGIMISSLLPVALVTEQRGGPSSTYANPFALFRQFPRWGRLVVPNIIFSIGASLFLPFINVYFRQVFGVPDALLGSLFAMMALVTGLAGLAAPLAAERLGQMRAIIALQLCSLPFLLGLGLFRWLPVIAACFWLRAALCKTADPLYSAFMMDQVEDVDRPLVNSLSTLTHRIGGTFMPFISGMIQIRYGFPPIFVGAALIYLLGSGSIYILFARPMRPTGDRQASCQ